MPAINCMLCMSCLVQSYSTILLRQGYEYPDTEQRYCSQVPSKCPAGGTVLGPLMGPPNRDSDLMSPSAIRQAKICHTKLFQAEAPEHDLGTKTGGAAFRWRCSTTPVRVVR